MEAGRQKMRSFFTSFFSDEWLFDVLTADELLHNMSARVHTTQRQQYRILSLWQIGDTIFCVRESMRYEHSRLRENSVC